MTSKSKPRSKRNEQKLIAASRHVFYESEMLDYCSNRLIVTSNEQLTNYEYAVLMESFLIHARNLHDFFYGKDKKNPPDEDDVIVEDFFIGNTPWTKPLKKGLYPEEITRINKQLAHISYTRAYKPISKRGEWDFEDIRMRLQRLVNDFIDKAPQATLDQDSLPGGPGRGRVYL